MDDPKTDPKLLRGGVSVDVRLDDPPVVLLKIHLAGDRTMTLPFSIDDAEALALMLEGSAQGLKDGLAALRRLRPADEDGPAK